MFQPTWCYYKYFVTKKKNKLRFLINKLFNKRWVLSDVINIIRNSDDEDSSVSVVGMCWGSRGSRRLLSVLQICETWNMIFYFIFLLLWFLNEIKFHLVTTVVYYSPQIIESPYIIYTRVVNSHRDVEWYTAYTYDGVYGRVFLFRQQLCCSVCNYSPMYGEKINHLKNRPNEQQKQFFLFFIHYI